MDHLVADVLLELVVMEQRAQMKWLGCAPMAVFIRAKDSVILIRALLVRRLLLGRVVMVLLA